MNKLGRIKFYAVGTIITIIALTVLEFPVPIGIETRPQDNVSPYWLILFFSIVISQFAAIPLIFKKPSLGAKLAMLAGVLNLVQIIADQAHLMQPEEAPIVYLLLEDLVGFFSLVLIYFSTRILALSYTDAG